MALPLRYNFRNVLVRSRATVTTILGIALVVAVFVVVQSLAAGLERASGNTGDERNLMIVRRGSNAESGSQITRDQFNSIQYSPEIARDTEGRPFVSADTLVILNLPRGGDFEGEANVSLRGISPNGFALRVPGVDREDAGKGTRSIVHALSSTEIAYAAGCLIVIHNTVTGGQRFLSGFKDDVVSVAVSPDRTRLAAGRWAYRASYFI